MNREPESTASLDLAWRMSANVVIGAAVWVLVGLMIHIGQFPYPGTFTAIMPSLASIGAFLGFLGAGALALTRAYRTRVFWSGVVAFFLTLLGCVVVGVLLGQLGSGIDAWAMVYITPVALVLVPATACITQTTAVEFSRRTAIYGACSVVILIGVEALFAFAS